MSPLLRTDESRVEIRDPLTDAEIASLVEDPEVSTIQTSVPLEPTTWARLNESFFSARLDVQARVYGFYTDVCDLRFCALLTHVRSFSADSLINATSVESLALMPRLRSLALDVLELETFAVLHELPEDLSHLSLGPTKSKKPSLKPVRRFGSLKSLSLVGHKKGIEVLADLSALEQLMLRSVSTPDVEYLAGLEHLWSLEVKLGGTTNFTALSDHPGLKYLELWMIRGLHDLSFVGRLPALENLFLQDLPHVRAFPDVTGCPRLRRVVIQNLHNLIDFTNLRSAPTLEDFHLLAGRGEPEDLIPVLENPHLRRVSAGFGRKALDLRFSELVSSAGLEKTGGAFGRFVYS